MPPIDGCFKVNIDRSHNRLGISSCGGLIRNDQGVKLHDFFCKIGSGNALWAKLWGLRLGIKLALQHNLNWVVFELDSKVVVDMVALGRTDNAYLQPLLGIILELLRLPCWKTTVVHAYREANRWADFLARKGQLVPSFDWVLVGSACPKLGLLLADDLRGSLLPRVVR